MAKGVKLQVLYCVLMTVCWCGRAFVLHKEETLALRNVNIETKSASYSGTKRDLDLRTDIHLNNDLDLSAKYSHSSGKITDNDNIDQNVDDKFHDLDKGVLYNEYHKRSISEPKSKPRNQSNAGASNDTDKGDNSTHEEPTEHKEHVKMHVASWNFEHVKNPFIISAFLIAAGIAKLGKHTNFLIM